MVAMKMFDTLRFVLLVVSAGLCLVECSIPTKVEEGFEASNCKNVSSFDFQGGDAWNTTHSQWRIRSSILTSLSNKFMALSFSEQPSSSAVSSPQVCTKQNETYALSFKYSISGGLRTPCALAIYLHSAGVVRRLWRSSFGTLSNFLTVSPSIVFSSCSSDFMLTFEGEKTEKGECGAIFNQIAFDNIKWEVDTTPLTEEERETFCTGIAANSPSPPGKRDGIEEEALTGVVSLCTTVVIVLIIIVALIACRWRKDRLRARRLTQGMAFKPDYRTLSEETDNRCPDYEDIEDDGKDTARAAPDFYNRLGTRGFPTVLAQEEGRHSHYDHFDSMDADGSSYSNLQRERRLQRGLVGENYNRV